MNRRYGAISERAQHRCEYCRAPEAMFNFPFEVEHIVPKSRTGADELANLALSCRSCNLYKSDSMTVVDSETKEEVENFHPRRHKWDEHFAFDTDSMKVEGVSATGRATVAKLQLNSAAQMASRRWWMSVGLFP